MLDSEQETAEPAVETHVRYRIALYYCYVPLSSHDIDGAVALHEALAANILGGRIRVASEGLNGVVSGLYADLMDYESQLRSFLISVGEAHRLANEESLVSWELDVKYCHLRQELSVKSQLFTDLRIERTRSVVGLVDMKGFFSPLSGSGGDGSDIRRGNDHRDHKLVKKGFNIKDQHKHAQHIFYKSLHNYNEVIPHLNRAEWDDKLFHLSNRPNTNVVLLDCRNSYESAIGYFVAPGGSAVTLLTNTRKYSELPSVLMQQVEEQASTLRTASHIFMYCTGGVRCERASSFLRTLLLENLESDNGTTSDALGRDRGAILPEIYQLHGGIQKYLEESSREQASNCLYKGKNFVFDQRRTDPTSTSVVVGQCLVCNAPHDDYDNGHAPVESKESRCAKCRVLILVCVSCRGSVTCWGDEDEEPQDAIGNPMEVASPAKRPLYCGGVVANQCLHRPPVQEIRHSAP
jgi:predicted sulfurtransferase